MVNQCMIVWLTTINRDVKLRMEKIIALANKVLDGQDITREEA